MKIEIPLNTPKYLHSEITLEVTTLTDVDGDDFVEICTKHYDGQNTQSVVIAPILLPWLIEALQKITDGKIPTDDKGELPEGVDELCQAEQWHTTRALEAEKIGDMNLTKYHEDYSKKCLVKISKIDTK